MEGSKTWRHNASTAFVKNTDNFKICDLSLTFHTPTLMKDFCLYFPAVYSCIFYCDIKG